MLGSGRMARECRSAVHPGVPKRCCVVATADVTVQPIRPKIAAESRSMGSSITLV